MHFTRTALVKSNEFFLDMRKTAGFDCAVLRANDKLVDEVPCVRQYGYIMCERKLNHITSL